MVVMMEFSSVAASAQYMHGKCIGTQDMLGTHKEYASNAWNTKQITSQVTPRYL